MVSPLPAVTVILLRDPYEVMMVQRNPNLKFMGGYWAFPGGKIEPSDASPEDAVRRELEEEAQIVLAPGVELVQFARWITPVGVPRRFDTSFYLAVVDTDVVPVADGSEIVDARWVSPADTGEIPIAFPTRKQLERIAGFGTIDELIAHARATPVKPILPEIVNNDGSPTIVLPQS